jgi:GNAT superfamily N-acetyltransferase
MATFDVQPLFEHFPPSSNTQRISAAIEDNLTEYWLAFADTPEGEVQRSGSVCWTYTGAPYFNRVVSGQLDRTSVDDEVQRIVEAFRARRAAVTWLVGPSCRPLDLGQRLERSGFSNVGRWKGMAHSLDRLDIVPMTRTGASARPVDGPEPLEDWIRVVGQSFALPMQAREFLSRYFRERALDGDSPWRHSVAYVSGNPVAASTLFMRRGVAGIYLVASLPGARQRGLGTTMTWLALRHAKRLGNDLAVLHATRDGERIYERLGFQHYCDIDLYRLGPPRPAWRRVGGRLARRLREAIHIV